MSRPSDLNIYIYLRKSRKDLEEEKKASELGETFDTLDRHRRNLIAVAKKERHNIIHIYEEVVSGESVTERPELQEMLRKLDANYDVVDGVLVMDLDRLGRGDMLDQGLLDRSFRYSGTKILTPNEFYDPESETWELVFGIKSLVAREELKAITRRMQRGRVASAGEGKSLSKYPPYGYARDEKLRLYPDIETAWVVKKMFEMMRDGQGRQAIANELDKLGIKPPTAKRDSWAPSSITAIIKNEVYVGKIIWGQMNYTKRNGKYQRKKMPRDTWTIKENAHEPLVSEELFDAANRAHTGRWRPSTIPAKKLANPLAGILKCEVCDYTMLYQGRKDRPNNFIRCATPTCRGVQKGASFEVVERHLINGLHKWYEALSYKVENEVTATTDAPYKRLLIEKKKLEITELTKQKNNLHDLLERGVYDIDTFVSRQQSINERMSNLEEEVRGLDGEIHKEELREHSEKSVVPQLKRIIDVYDKSTPQIKNELLKTVLEKATYLRKKEWVDPEEIQIILYSKT